jgi:rod shape-determining protein MreD
MGAAAGLGFCLGLLADAFSGLAFGSNALALVVVGALGARTRDLFVGDSIAFLAWYLLIGKVARDLIHWVVVGESLREPFAQAILVDATLAGIYATAVGMVAFTLSGARWETPR